MKRRPKTPMTEAEGGVPSRLVVFRAEDWPGRPPDERPLFVDCARCRWHEAQLDYIDAHRDDDDYAIGQLDCCNNWVGGCEHNPRPAYHWHPETI